MIEAKSGTIILRDGDREYTITQSTTGTYADCDGPTVDDIQRAVESIPRREPSMFDGWSGSIDIAITPIEPPAFDKLTRIAALRPLLMANRLAFPVNPLMHLTWADAEPCKRFTWPDYVHLAQPPAAVLREWARQTGRDAASGSLWRQWRRHAYDGPSSIAAQCRGFRGDHDDAVDAIGYALGRLTLNSPRAYNVSGPRGLGTRSVGTDTRVDLRPDTVIIDDPGVRDGE